MTSRLTTPTTRPLVAPSVIAGDYAHVARECRDVLDAGADLLHLDVMDGHFVPNLTLGPDMCRCIRNAFPDALLDVHLMVTDPLDFVDAFAKAGADHLTLHLEANLGSPGHAAAVVRDHAITFGLAINPETPAEALEPHLHLLDLALVMSVNPGRSGQTFIEHTLEKTRWLAPRLHDHQRLQMDGGISPSNSTRIRDAGCDVLVAGSAVFGLPSDRRPEAIRAIRED